MTRNSIGIVQRWLARMSSGFVLAFHEITPTKMEALIDGLAPCKPVSLTELIGREKSQKRTNGLFAITVDDGVGYTVSSLSPLFLRRQWPATFFVPTGYVDTNEGIGFQWWQQLRPLLPARRLELKSTVLDLSRPGAKETLFRELERMWHTERQEAYLPLLLELVDLVSRDLGIPKKILRPPTPVSWKEVARLSKSDLIQFESHGVSHTAMSCLSDTELFREMRESRSILTEHTGRECRHLAYPFGSPRSIGDRAVKIASWLYDSASTMTLGHINGANPWLLPRVPLYPENSMAFARLKILLKCTPLDRLRLDRAIGIHPSPQMQPAGGRVSIAA